MKYKEKIKSIGLSIAFVAIKLDIHRSALSNYLNGYRPMPIEVENKLKSLLKKYPTND